MLEIKLVQATAKYIRMSAYKVRRVLKQIKGRSYFDSLLLLKLMPYRSCTPIWQVLYSAVSNANHNFNLKKSDLFIFEAFANEGVKLKRIQPRAKGRAYKILKPTCHITIIVKSIVKK